YLSCPQYFLHALVHSIFLHTSRSGILRWIDLFVCSISTSFGGCLFGRSIVNLLQAVFVFLSLSMFAFFGMLIIVRHQILLFDGSFFKLSSPLRYLSYFTLFCTFQILTVFTALTIQSDRDRQIYTLAKMYPQLKWRERRLNWHLFDGYKFPNLLKASTYFIYIFVSFWFAFVFLPFVHIFFIVIRSGRNRSRCKTKRTHLRQAKTVIVQFLVLLLFLAIPLMLGYSSIWRDNIYAETQILMAVGEMLFASSTLANSCVVILRNPVYVTELSSVFRYAFRFARKRVSVSIARIS
ncbi:hypothetical protein PFISCL1PPCAC_14298, partial [Pristionchus fissidentatus]